MHKLILFNYNNYLNKNTIININSNNNNYCLIFSVMKMYGVNILPKNFEHFVYHLLSTTILKQTKILLKS